MMSEPSDIAMHVTSDDFFGSALEQVDKCRVSHITRTRFFSTRFSVIG